MPGPPGAGSRFAFPSPVNRVDSLSGAQSLLLEFARTLHLANVPADIVEYRVASAGRGLGVAVEAFAMQTVVIVRVAGASHQIDFARMPFNPHWNLGRLGQLEQLGDEMAAGTLGIEEARAWLERIRSWPARYPKWVVAGAYGVYGLAVAARIGGGAVEVGAAGLVGLAVGIIHFGIIRHRTADLQKSFLAALFGTLLALALAGFFPYSAAHAAFGGMAMLVPGMVLALGTHEMVGEAVEAGLARVAYALLRFLMLAFGIVGAAAIWRALGPLPPRITATPLPLPVVLAAVVVGGIALVACLQGQRRDLPWIAGAALLAYGSQEVLEALFAGRGSPFIAAFVVGAAGGLFHRASNRAPGIIVVPGILQLVPGFLGVRSMLALLGQDAPSDATFVHVLLVCLQLVTGLMAAGLVFDRGGPDRRVTTTASPPDRTTPRLVPR